MRTTLFLMIILLCGLTSPNIVHAEPMTVEIIQLHNRTAEEIVPILEPLLPEGGSVSAFESQLIVRTTRQSLLEIKKVLKNLDTPAKQLMVQVRQGAVSKQGQTDLIGPVPILHSSDSGKSQTLQNIKVLDGSRAMIHMGNIFPAVTYYYTADGFVTRGTTYLDDITGFYVRPQVIGNSVQLQISTQQKNVASGNKATIDAEKVQSTMQVPLGQWVAIGGTSKDRRYKGYFIFFGSKAYREIDTAVFVKIDLVTS